MSDLKIEYGGDGSNLTAVLSVGESFAKVRQE